ncbi:hypothetical protein KR084_002610 [Drosophila pseudotakahashii]|nr:hypothetical protein KR084_002610 [Drosophila pseudotakahashii]
MLTILISVVLLQCILQSTSGLYFHMRENERKCFIQEAAEETRVLVQYKVEEEDPSSGGTMPVSPGIGMHVDIRDSDDRVVLSRVYDSEARLMFTTHWPGDHHICLEPKGSVWINGALLRVHLKIKVGEQTVDYANARRKQQLDNMQLRVLQLMNQAEDIYKNQNYQRFREERFRQTSESIFFTIIYCSVAQVVVLIILLAIQYHLLFRRTSLYHDYCKLFSEEELTRFRTPEAFRALMSILGPTGQGLTTSTISQWIAKMENLDATNEKEEILISEMIPAKVEEFAGKLLIKPAPDIPVNSKASHYASKVQLTRLLSSAKRNRSVHLKGDTFLLVCECEECKAKDPDAVDAKA